PASGVQGSHLTHPALTQITSQQTGVDESYMAPPPAEYPGDQASRPLPVDSLPSSTGTIGTVGNTTINETTGISPAEPAPSLPGPGATQFPNQAPTNPMPQPLAWEKPETQPVTFEWNPSPSGNAAGYIIRVSTTSAQTNYTFKTGQETRLVVDLPRGESYIATVLAYNIAGESLPAAYIRFDLF
ncbi:MAG TPA: fibronectin type III domain-containing protein, partial [Nitrospira sp.]